MITGICLECKKENILLKVAPICGVCFAESVAEASKEITLDAFPEMNGLPAAEPKTPYGKMIRKTFGW
jgi:hypothetical protein